MKTNKCAPHKFRQPEHVYMCKHDAKKQKKKKKKKEKDNKKEKEKKQGKRVSSARGD